MIDTTDIFFKDLLWRLALIQGIKVRLCMCVVIENLHLGHVVHEQLAYPAGIIRTEALPFVRYKRLHGLTPSLTTGIIRNKSLYLGSFLTSMPEVLPNFYD